MDNDTLAQFHVAVSQFKDAVDGFLNPDSILIVDKHTGCYWLGNKLIHTDSCMCGDYDD